MKNIYNVTGIRIIQWTLFLILCGFLPQAQAHNLFLSVQENIPEAHDRVNIAIGWGHTTPVDEFFDASQVNSYVLYIPSLQRMDLQFDPRATKGIYAKKAPYRKEYKEATVQGGTYLMNTKTV